MYFLSKPFNMALFINSIFFFLVIFFCDMKYEVSDDFVMDAILSGAYGTEYDSHLLFSNILLGYVLKIIYTLIPVVSWYFVMQITLCFIALTTVSYIILKQSPNIWGLLLCVVFVSFFSDDLYLLVQFTKTAAACAMAGGVLILYAFWKEEGRMRVWHIIFGALICLVGSMVRFSCIYIALAFLALSYLRYVYIFLKSHTEKKRQIFIQIIGGVLLCGCIVLSARGLSLLNRYLWSKDEAYASYFTQNNARASITDIGGYNQDEVIAALEGLEGTTIEDYYMLISWNFVDQDIYTQDRIAEFSSIFHSLADYNNHAERIILRTLFERHYEKYTVVWGIILLIIFMLVCRRNAFLYTVLQCATAGSLMFYLVYQGRIVYRVEYSIFFCLAASLVIELSRNDKKEHNVDLSQNEKDIKEGIHRNKICLCGVLLLLLIKVPLYIPDISYQTMTDEEYDQYIYDVFYDSWKFDLRKYRACVNKRPCYNELITVMEQDDNYYYLCDFTTTIQTLYYHYKPWFRMPIGYYAGTYSYFGGVTNYFPGCYYVWSVNGLDAKNPYRTITNDNIRVVDNLYQLTKINYYKQYYNVNAVEQEVGSYSGYSVWKIFD